MSRNDEDSNQLKEIGTQITDLSSFDPQKDILSVILELHQNIKAIPNPDDSPEINQKIQSLTAQLTSISKDLFIKKMLSFIESLKSTDEEIKLNTDYQTLLNQITIEQILDQQDESFEKLIQNSDELKETITKKLLDLRQQYLVKSDRQTSKDRKPIALEDQTESVLNYIVENTKVNQDTSPIDWFKRNLLSNIGSLIPKDMPDEPLATYSFNKLLQIQKDLDAYLHPKLAINEKVKNALSDHKNISRAMQAAIDANGKDCMFENKWCKLNILKIIKKQFDKKGISPEEKAFYLLLFLKTAGTHRNTNSFFQSPGTETASIQAFKNSLGTHSFSDLSNFIDTTIIGVLNDDKKLRGLKKN